MHSVVIRGFPGSRRRFVSGLNYHTTKARREQQQLWFMHAAPKEHLCISRMHTLWRHPICTHLRHENPCLADSLVDNMGTDVVLLSALQSNLICTMSQLWVNRTLCYAMQCAWFSEGDGQGALTLAPTDLALLDMQVHDDTHWYGYGTSSWIALPRVQSFT
jgi:hypothetical protein